MGMPSSCYSKALREPVHFLWERRRGGKINSARFRSKNSTGIAFGRGLLVYDHAIPFRYLQTELLNLIEVTINSVRKVLDKFETIVVITKEENDLLNAGGYGSEMPGDWDGKDHLARYKAVGIEIVRNTSDSS